MNVTLDNDEAEDLGDTVSTAKLTPFVKWVGGKRKQADYIASWCSQRLGAEGCYFEPFLGGGAVALAMPAGTPMVLADVNEALGYLWWWIANDPHGVGDIARSLGINFGDGYNTERGYYEIRADFNTLKFDAMHPAPSAKFLWLIHACHGGVYRENNAGGFNVPTGRRPKIAIPSAERLCAIFEHLQTADIRPGWDFEDVLAEAKDGDVVYADPPYDGDVTAFTGYVSKPFGPSEQERLAKVLWAAFMRGASVIATNADTERVRALYADFDIEVVTETRAIGNATGGSLSAPCVRITSR